VTEFPPPEPPRAALESLVHSRYGVSFVDLGIAYEDLADFDRIAIGKSKDLNLFGPIADVSDPIAAYLTEIGPNSRAFSEKIGKKIQEIAAEIMAVSEKPCAWICLRAATPNSQYNLSRWHMDGYYYKSWPEVKIQYKFAITLVGPSTMFYPIPCEYGELRNAIWVFMINRQLMHELCSFAQPITVPRGYGAFFIAGDRIRAAIHSEPRIDQTHRLFFSIVSGDATEIAELKATVDNFYKSNASVNP